MTKQRVFYITRLLSTAFTANTVDMALEIAALEQLCQHILIQHGHRAGIKAQLLLKFLQKKRRQDQIPDTQRGGNGL